MRKLVRRVHYWFRRRQLDADLAEEMEFHRMMLARLGAAPVVMGNTTLAREDARGVWIWPWLESFWQDFAYGVRTLRRQPGFTLMAVGALASAIGINTSLFTAFNAVALRPWPVQDPGSVVNVWQVKRDGPGKGTPTGFAIAEARYLAGHAESFRGVIAMQNGESVKLEGQPRQLTYVSGSYFRVLGVQMERGRGFVDEEDRNAAPQAVAVISAALWRNRFGEAPDIVGRPIRLDDIPFTVVGVASQDFTGTSPLRNDVWVPLPAKKLLRPNAPDVENYLTSASYCCTPMAARLASGVSKQQAREEVVRLLGQFREQSGLKSDQSIVLTGTSGIDDPGQKPGAQAVVLSIFIAVTMVLLLACANVGNLLLARAAARRHEIAVRLSLGGSRVRLIRQLLVESLSLAVAAAAIGLAIASVAASIIASRLADQVYHMAPDLRVLAYTIALAFLACLAFGLAPALHATRGDIAGALKAEGRLVGVRLSLRSTLLAVQVAVSVALLAGAGLLARGLQRTQTQDPGFEIQNVTVLSLDLPANEYTGTRTGILARQLVAQLDRVAGMPVCGVTMDVPLSRGVTSTAFHRRWENENQNKRVVFHEVSGGYFDVLGIPVTAGRSFVAADAGREVVIVNQTTATRYWPGRIQSVRA